MIMYEIISDMIFNKLSNDEITFNEAAVLQSCVDEKFIYEKKTKEQYRKEKFKKKYNYDPKTETITVDGERIPIKITGRKDDYDTGSTFTHLSGDTMSRSAVKQQLHNAIKQTKEKHKKIKNNLIEKINKDKSLSDDEKKRKINEIEKKSTNISKGDIYTAGRIKLHNNNFKTGNHEATLWHELGHRYASKLRRRIRNGKADNEEKERYDKLLQGLKENNIKMIRQALPKHELRDEEMFADYYAKQHVGEKNAKKDITRMYKDNIKISNRITSEDTDYLKADYRDRDNRQRKYDIEKYTQNIEKEEQRIAECKDKIEKLNKQLKDSSSDKDIKECELQILICDKKIESSKFNIESYKKIINKIKKKPFDRKMLNEELDELKKETTRYNTSDSNATAFRNNTMKYNDKLKDSLK